MEPGTKLPADRIVRLLARLNAARNRPPDACLNLLEAVVEDLFAASQHLAVYGSLAPGRTNHFMLEELAGSWTAGTVRGELHEPAPATGRRFPALVWDPKGPPVDVMVLSSPALRAAWQGLDAFEGPGYRRTLVPVEDASGTVIVANIYELSRSTGTTFPRSPDRLP